MTDEARALWQQEKRTAETNVIRGVTQIAMSIPIVIVGGALAFFFGGKYSVMIALGMLALTMASVGRGAVRLVRGARDARRAARELAALDTKGQLPAARIVER